MTATVVRFERFDDWFTLRLTTTPDLVAMVKTVPVQHPIPKQRPADEVVQPKQCAGPYCDKTFYLSRSDARYCGDTCREQARPMGL